MQTLKNLLDKFYFSTPAYLVFLHFLWITGLMLAGALWLKLAERPRPTRQSRYLLLGKDATWILTIILYAVCVVALAGPKVFKGYSLAQAGSVDAVIMLDDSSSTLAKDVKPSRFEAMRMALLSFANGGVLRPGDRITLFVFAGDAKARMPLSEDVNEFKDRLAELEQPKVYEEEYQMQTDVSAALDLVTICLDKQDGFEKNNSWGLRLNQYHNSRVAFLFSDGDDQGEGKPQSGIREFVKRKIKVFSVGVGREGPSTVEFLAPAKDPDAKPEKVKIKTSLHKQELEQIARGTGGESFFLDSDGRRGELQAFMRNAVAVSRSSLPRLVRVGQERDVWWEILAIPAVVILLSMIFKS